MMQKILTIILVLSSQLFSSYNCQDSTSKFSSYNTSIRFARSTHFGATSNVNFISFSEIKNRLETYKNSSIKDYKETAFDPKTNTILIGARDTLLTLSSLATSQLTPIDLLNLEPSSEVLTECLSKSKDPKIL